MVAGIGLWKSHRGFAAGRIQKAMKNLLMPTLIATGLPAQNAPPTVTGSVSGHVFDMDTNIVN
jgi:hypothetical protein